MEQPGTILCLGRCLTVGAALTAVLLGSPDRGSAGYGYLASRQEATVFIVDIATAA